MRVSAFIVYILAITAPLLSVAQRTVTPVESDDKKPEAPTLHYYDKHGNLLDEPVLFLATLDTVPSAKVNARPLYPRLYAVDCGLNFMDGILAIAGQQYGGADIWASLSLWNWLFPTIEAGVGGARMAPQGSNFTYKGTPSMYARVGADYNFLYKSNPDYKLMAGLRAGFSSFSYSLTDITINDSYWGQTAHFSLPSQTSTALWGEILGGIRVNIARAWGLGWTFRYRFMFSCSESDTSRAAYVPGYGARDNHLGVTMSVIYTIPLVKEPKDKTEHLSLPTP